MTLLDLPHGKTQTMNLKNSTQRIEQGEAEPKQACQLWLLMELVREFQTPTQNATTTQEIHSRETEEEQPQMEVTETAAEPEAEQEEADQMRDTEVGSAALATPSPAYAAFDLPPGWEQWSTRLSLGDGTGEGNEAGGPRPHPLNWSKMSTKQEVLWRKTQQRNLAQKNKSQKPKIKN